MLYVLKMAFGTINELKFPLGPIVLCLWEQAGEEEDGAATGGLSFQKRERGCVLKMPISFDQT